MKYFIYPLLISAFSCSTKPPNSMQIKGKAYYKLSVGYGNIYACIANEKPRINSLPDTLSLVFLAGDPLEKEIKQNQIQTFTFNKAEENVPYAHMPTTGFVDRNMTLWKLISIR